MDARTVRPLPRLLRRALAPAALGLTLLAAAAPAPGAGSAPAAPEAAGLWTLERVLERVRSSDPGIRAAKEGADAGRAEGNTAWSALSPRLRFEAGLLRTDDPAVLFTEKLWQGRFGASDFELPRLNDPPAETAVSAGLVLEQPLWNGGAEITSPGMASAVRAAAAASGDSRTAEGLLAAVDAYVGAVRAREALAADSLALVAAEEGLRAAVERHRQGLVPEMDTLRATARRSEARVGWLGSRTRSRVTLVRLARLLDAPLAQGDVGGLPDVGPTAVPAGDGSSGSAADRRGEVRGARARARVLEIEARRAGLRLLPSLNSRFALAWYRPWEDGDFERRWSAGVSLDFPIWDGTRRVQEWRAARARAREADAGLEAMRRDLDLAAREAMDERILSGERSAAALAARAAAEEALRFALARYRAGLLPVSELLAAEADAARLRRMEVEARAEVVLAHYRYLHSMGELR